MESGISRVFVGNIPYDATEQQMVDMFSAVGKVLQFRIQCDRQTGKPAGFGFCEFADAATAQSAIRNLNNKEFHGRTLRVDLADQERRQVAPEERTRAQVGEQLEAVSRVVTAMSLSQRHDVLAQMQAFAIQQPALAYQLLTQFPQLAHALLDAQVSLGTVRGPDLLAVQQLPPPVAPPPVAGAPPVQPFPAAMAPPMAHPMQQQWPPRQDAWPAQAAPPPPSLPASIAALTPEQHALLRQLMQATPEQFAALPAPVQEQVRMLHAYMAGQR